MAAKKSMSGTIKRINSMKQGPKRQGSIIKTLKGGPKKVSGVKGKTRTAKKAAPNKKK